MAYIDEWRRWHAARADALSAPYGPLSSMCGIRVRSTIGSPTDFEGVHTIRVAGQTTLASQADWTRRIMRLPLGVPDESVELETLTPQQQNLIEAEGIFALDAIEDRIHHITFAGLEIFEPHHDWVVPATVDELPDREAINVVSPCTDGRNRSIVLDAIVRFELEGRPYELLATHEPQGAFHAVFSDETRVHGFPFRNIRIAAPAVDRETTIDFNRSVLPLAAMSTRFPAVSAPPGNHLDAPVAAGEHRPYLDDALGQAQFA